MTIQEIIFRIQEKKNEKRIKEDEVFRLTHPVNFFHEKSQIKRKYIMEEIKRLDMDILFLQTGLEGLKQPLSRTG